jgi:hypothetical protein
VGLALILDYPSWTLEMQIMTPEKAEYYRFDILDLTKVCPQGDFPPIKIGKLVLNRNQTNYFAEVEQAAFSHANLVTGIGISPDKMLQAMVFFLSRYPYPPSWSQLSPDPGECAKALYLKTTIIVTDNAR